MSPIHNKAHYYNTINLQVEALQQIVDVQIDRCFDFKKLAGLMPEETLQGLRRVVMTGCGDSYSAAGAMLPSFKANSGIDAVSAPDPMDFCKFYTKADTCMGHQPQEVLVIAVSASGGSQRIVEIMEKGRAQGAHTLLITNNPESAGAKAAQFVFPVETPEGCNSPGLRSYFASMLALTALGAYLGLIKHRLTRERFSQIQQLIAAHVKAFGQVYEAVDQQVYTLAKTWKDFKRFEVVGDWDEYFSAQFVEEKFIECAGVHCTHTNSEDWCHINFFLKDPETIGTIFHAPYHAQNFDRVQNAIHTALAIGRPTLVVTDAPEEEVPEGAVYCRMPAPPEVWLSPITDFAPGSLLAAYVAALADKLFFTGRYDFRTQTWLNM